MLINLKLFKHFQILIKYIFNYKNILFTECNYQKLEDIKHLDKVFFSSIDLLKDLIVLINIITYPVF